MARIYGKQKKHTSATAAQCFAASSSPDTPGLKAKRARASDAFFKNDDLEIESLTKDVSNLNVDPSADSPCQNTRSRKVLRERTANTIKYPSLDGAADDDVADPGADESEDSEKRETRPTPTTTAVLDVSSVQHQDPPKTLAKAKANNHKHLESLLSHVTEADFKDAPRLFADWAAEVEQHLKVTKIAEASFGEVYRLAVRELDPALESTAESVLKIIALRPGSNTKSLKTGKAWTKNQKARIQDTMSDPDNVASEARLLQHLRDVPGFTNFRSLLVVEGKMPQPFLQAWRDFNSNVEQSMFPDPGTAGNGYLNGEQQWAVLEMEDAGQALEGHDIDDIFTLWDAFWNITISLAKGEEAASFEHRDLHLGNVCAKRPAGQPLDLDRKLGFTGLETTLIDYSLSRAELAPATPDKLAEVAFFDLSKDDAIFQGNGEDEYQYDIYRHMRGAVVLGDPLHTAAPAPVPAWARRAGHPGPWREFAPLSNVVWLHYVLHVLTEKLAGWPSAARQPRAADARRRHAVALKLERCTRELTAALALDQLVAGGLGSAGGLVARAVAAGWLDEGDVLGAEGEGEAEGSFLSIVQGVAEMRVAAGEGEDEDDDEVVFRGRRSGA